MTNIFDLPDDSLVRLSSILPPHGPVPISRSTWFMWRKAGKAPSPIRLGPGVVAYRVGAVRALVHASGTAAGTLHK